jgi:hypothetical protein
MVCALLLSASTAGAAVVADWNVIAGQSIDSGALRGPSGILDFAIVHAAMHDAARAYQGRFRIAPRRGCVRVAGCRGRGTAHAVLVALFPVAQPVDHHGSSVTANAAASRPAGPPQSCGDRSCPSPRARESRVANSRCASSSGASSRLSCHSGRWQRAVTWTSAWGPGIWRSRQPPVMIQCSARCAGMSSCPHRPEAQDAGLSRR